MATKKSKAPKASSKKTATPKVKEAVVHSVLNKDHKRLIVDGEEMPKSKVALAIIAKFVAKHPKITMEKLTKEFPIALHPAGLFLPLTTARKKNAKRRRFYTDSPIEVENRKIAVCKEFGTNNMTPLIETAQKHGFKISRVDSNTRKKAVVA